MDPLIIVSGDGHVGPPVEHFRDYLEPKYREWMPEVLAEEDKFQILGAVVGDPDPALADILDERHLQRSGAGARGAWDTATRLEQMDAEGIVADVLFPAVTGNITPFFYNINKPYPDDVRMAGMRAYHRWLADMIAPSKGRLVGTADSGPMLDMAETLKELKFVSERGFRQVFLPGMTYHPALPHLADPYYEPLWSACVDLGLVLSIHVGWGQKQGDFTKMIDEITKVMDAAKAGGPEMSHDFEENFQKLKDMVDEDNPDSVFSMDLAPRQALWQLIFGGVFDRHPELKLSIAECRADWVPEWKERVDRRFMEAARRPNIKLKPTEYFGKNVFVTPTAPRRLEVEMRHEIGVDAWLFGADFPHPEGTWPNTLAWLRACFFDVPESELRLMLGENAIKLYGFDRGMLSGVAAKIGPSVQDILGDHTVDERVLAEFDRRSGFTHRSPSFDPQMVDRKINSDMAFAERLPA